MIHVLVVVAVSAAFVAGQKYGSLIEKKAEIVALAAFDKAKAVLTRVLVKAQADAKAEAERLEALAKKYL
jgi:hypothetical protein